MQRHTSPSDMGADHPFVVEDRSYHHETPAHCYNWPPAHHPGPCPGTTLPARWHAESSDRALLDGRNGRPILCCAHYLPTIPERIVGASSSFWGRASCLTFASVAKDTRTTNHCINGSSGASTAGRGRTTPTMNSKLWSTIWTERAMIAKKKEKEGGQYQVFVSHDLTPRCKVLAIHCHCFNC